MLEAMRRGAQTWVAKLLFGVLVFSFAIWGVADVFTGWGRGSIAKVGGIPITVEEFNRSYQSELDNFSRQANKRLTAEQGHALGLDRRVLNQLVGGAAFEHHAQDLGLSLSDATLVEMVTKDPDFQGPDGTFSRIGFDSMLRQLGVSEKGFLSLKRRDELRTGLIGTLVKAQAVPKPMLETLHAYNQEKRTFEHVTIDSEKAVTVPEPDDAKLKERYDAGKSSFMTPEYRKLEVLILSTEELKKTITITDEEIAAEYESTKETYNVPEKRRVQQISFKDKAAADAAKKALTDGSKTFGDVAKDAGAQDTDVDLGLIAKSSLIDPKVADAAFSLEEQKVSDVIEGRFTNVIVRVTQIVPGTIKTLADVKDEVKDKLATDKARHLLQDRIDEVEDARNTGKTLKEIADEKKYLFKEVAGTDRKGMTHEGQPAFDGLDFRKLTDMAFSNDPGTEQPSSDLSDGSHAWVNVIAIEAPKQKTFEEVKDEVKAQYMESERVRLIGELANKLVERLNKGEAMSAIASETGGGSVGKTDPVTRNTIPQGLSEAAVAQGFALTLNKAGSAESADKQSRTIIKVVEVTPAAAPTKEDLDKLAKETTPNLANQTLAQYIEALKTGLGTTINESEFKRAVGVTEE